MDFVELTPEEAESLRQQLCLAKEYGGLRKVRVAVDGDHVKFKINEHTWSPPLGKKGVAY